MTVKLKNSRFIVLIFASGRKFLFKEIFTNKNFSLNLRKFLFKKKKKNCLLLEQTKWEVTVNLDKFLIESNAK